MTPKQRLYFTRSEEKTMIEKAASAFPAEYGLRAFPGRRFRISIEDSYLAYESGDDQPPVILLYTHVFSDERGEWLAFAKGTPSELRKEVTE